MDEQNRSKRIAKNTLFLYLRMILVMIISLYTSRVNLKNLGVENFGIYNIVGGIVVLFTFISNPCSTATARYLNFALGENNKEKARDYFSVSVVINLGLSLLFLVLAETVGLWLLNNYLVIPEERIKAANIIYQFSIFSAVLGITKIPYNASVISHEKMSFYAVMSIFECVGKLLVAILLPFSTIDRLIFFAFLIFLIGAINLLVFKIYASIKFDVCHFRVVKNKVLFKELLSFSGWTLLSSVGGICSNQGLNMIMNHFFGVVANAAIGIANQVNNAVYQLLSNFQIAFEPQITKSYAANEKDYLLDLIFKTSKLSYYLLWFFVLPLGLNVSTVLNVWLTEVPVYSDIFLRLILLLSLLDAIAGPLWMLAYAIGNMKVYQIVAFVLPVLLLPVAYFVFLWGAPPYILVLLRFISGVIFAAWRLGYLKKRMEFPILLYLKKVILPCIIITVLSLVVSYFSFVVTGFNIIVQFFVSCTITVLCNILLMWFIGLSSKEKEFVIMLIRRRFGK